MKMLCGSWGDRSEGKNACWESVRTGSQVPGTHTYARRGHHREGQRQEGCRALQTASLAPESMRELCRENNATNGRASHPMSSSSFHTHMGMCPCTRLCIYITYTFSLTHKIPLASYLLSLSWLLLVSSASAITSEHH